MEKQIVDSKTVNGASVSAHVEQAVRQDMASGMSEEQARIKWRAQKPEALNPDNDVIYVYRLYQRLMDCRTYGVNGLNPLNIHDIEAYERRYGMIPEPILTILFDMDELFYEYKD